jgi:hypothetical protein
MIFAQISSGNKLHLACEAGEVYWGKVVRSGYVSAPLCRTSAFRGNYRMNINVPLAHACKNCLRIERNHRYAEVEA